MGDKLRRLFRNMDMSMVIIVIILLANNFLNNSMSFGEWMYSKAVILPAIFIGLTFHEAAHGFASHWLGDPTPGMQGRLTLNPLKHMDPVGFICLMFAGFGWGVPVQIDPRYYKHRRSGEMIVGLAGVTTNFAIALIFSFVAKYMAENMSWEFYEGIGKESQRSETPAGVRTAFSGLSRRLDTAEGRVSEQEGMSVNLPKSKSKESKD